MKRSFTLAVIVLAAASLGAMPGRAGMAGISGIPGISPQDILSAVPGAADKTPGELTLGERVALASGIAVAMEKVAYVRHAAMASMMLPGAGQLMTGDYGIGALHLGAEALIFSGGLVGLWFLTPADLKDFSMTMDARHALMRSYMTPDRIGAVLPAMGVATGGLLLSAANRMISSRGAAGRARANIESGKVVFQPEFSMMGGGMSLGLAIMRK
jgi:hypothetical protein